MTALPLALLATAGFAATPEEVVSNYADIAEAGYSDSLTTAQALREAVAALVETPSEETLTAARAAWTAARVPYQQTEVFRFGNAIVDDWEGRVNAWPLDEGLIDYVAENTPSAEDNELAHLNVIANSSLDLSGEVIDAATITPELISGQLHEAGGIEANVASGYHAIEFLLWGQDLNGTGPGAGERPYTDYIQGDGCTGGNCDRRAQYLTAVTDLLIADLEEMVANWSAEGEARATVTGDPQAGLNAILTGMGSLSYGEQAGERMKLGLMLNDPEEEHDCFSDQTQNSHYYDGLGIQNVYLGHYKRVDGSEVSGPAISELVAAADADVDTALKAGLETSVAALTALKEKADNGMAYDQMLAPGNVEGEETIMAAVDALVAQTTEIERAVAALGLSKIEFEGSDSLDNPNAVFQ
ncbi:imelysin family protein [Paracoccus sp. SCSIO 75233]|uniref:imelysin family protein n=1 Tax=Paracoccus sp. SCSIO 75233 TaxID=3017782 RepID=UPI0022F0ED9E|nr:imelysin family protein [Paracoccus sp. SCSIO 75233]WBU54787.1 peptidase [Paracoccus sp. SCSIO 75233]